MEQNSGDEKDHNREGKHWREMPQHCELTGE
jgi:hypothetical protein